MGREKTAVSGGGNREAVQISFISPHFAVRKLALFVVL